MRRWKTGVAMIVVLAAVLGAAAPMLIAQEAIGAQNAIDCPEGVGWLECKAQAGDRMALYKLGRTAYDNARGNGDFTEALRLARQLANQNDKNGERLLKMVHLQLGWGAHQDYVQAYRWLSEDRTADADYVDKSLKTLAEKMTPEQLARAQAPAGH